jgi:hypothetical protein
MAPTPTDLDGYARTDVYEDGTLIRVSVRQTTDAAYPSGWRYTLHYGALAPAPPETLADGTIRRYDNAHEDTRATTFTSLRTLTQRSFNFRAWLTSTNGSGRKCQSRGSGHPTRRTHHDHQYPR